MKKCPDQQLLLDYAAGKLPEVERLAVSRHLQDCDFCSEAAKGLALLYDPADLQDLHQKVARKFGTPDHHNPFISSAVLKIAAVLLLATGSGAVLYNVLVNRSTDQIVTQDLREKIQSPSPAGKRPSDARRATEPSIQQLPPSSEEAPDTKNLNNENIRQQVTSMDNSGTITEDLSAEKTEAEMKTPVPLSPVKEEADFLSDISVQDDEISSKRIEPSMNYTSMETIQNKSASTPSSVEVVSGNTSGGKKFTVDGIYPAEQVNRLVNTGNLSEAYTLLDSVITNTAWPANQQASLRKAELLISEGKNEEARQVLRKMDKRAGPYRDRARLMLDTL